MAEQFLETARRLRSLAEQENDIEFRAKLIRLAEEYEQMAEKRLQRAS